MSKRDWLLFVATFVMAVLCGMYLYFTTFVPEYVANPVVQELAEQTAPDWSLGVRLYGGCDRGNRCPAFELTSRGAYRYQVTPEAAIETGSLSTSLRARFDEVLSEELLLPLSQPTGAAAAACASAYDGIDYTLVATLKRERFTLDTCRTTLPNNHSLVALIDEALRNMDNPATATDDGPAPRSGLSGYIERKLDETFDYDDQ